MLVGHALGVVVALGVQAVLLVALVLVALAVQVVVAAQVAVVVVETQEDTVLSLRSYPTLLLI
jgi:hypothetical protein